MAESRSARPRMDRSSRQAARGSRSGLFRDLAPRVESLEVRITPTVDVWTGASSNVWSDPGNWTLGLPAAGQDLDFPSGATNKTSVYDAALEVSSFGAITIDSAGYDISASFAGSLTLTGGISTTYASAISNFDIGLDPGNGAASVAAGGTLELGGAIAGTSGLAVSGGGTLQLGGGSSNTFAGATTVAGATTLLLDKSGATAVPGNLTIGGGGTVRLAQSDQIADASLVTEGPGATLDLSNFSDTLGGLNLTGATVATGTGTLTLGGDVTTNSASTTSVISGHLDLGGATRAFTVADEPQLDPDLSITANIGGTGAGLTKLGANSQLLLSGDNTYDGTTTIAAGAVEIASDTALGASSAGTVVNSGLSLALLGDITVPEPITISGVGFGGLGAIFNGNGNNAITGGITLGAASTVGSLIGNLTLGGVITDGASSFALTKVCAGTVTLTGANTYDGGTIVTAGLNGSGVLAISNGSALGTGSATIANGSELDLSGDITLSRDLSFLGTGVGGNGALRSVSGNNTCSGTATLQADGTRIRVDAGQLTLSGDLTDGGNSYEADKTGAGVLLISGEPTTSGSLQSRGGDVRITDTYTSSVTLNGGNIGGTGTVGDLNQVGGTTGTVDPGSASGTTGQLRTVDGYQVGTGGTTHIDIGGTTAGTTYDQVVNSTSGGVDITDSNIEVALLGGFVPAIGDVFTVIDKQNGGAIAGTFHNLAEGATFRSGVVTYAVSYVGGTGNDVTLTVVGVAYTWTGLGGDGNWSTAANWDANRAPGGGEDLVFPAGAARSTNNNDLSGKSFRSIAVAGGYDITGNAITLTGGISYTDASNTSEFHPGITLTATEAVDVADGGDFILSGAISGPGFGVTKTGGGTLEYTGFSANTYTGATTVNAGMLILNRASGQNAVAGDLVIGDNVGGGGSVDLGSNDQIADGSSVTVNEGATLDLGTSGDTIGTLTLQGATVNIGAGGVLGVSSGVVSNATTNNLTSTISGPGTFALSNGYGTALHINVADDPGVAVELRIAASIVGGNRGIIKDGAGTLALAGTSSTYDSNTSANAGVILVETDNALGHTNLGVVNSGASIDFSGENLSISRSFNIFSGAGFNGTDALGVLSGAATITGNIGLYTDAQIGAASNSTLTIGGSIRDSTDFGATKNLTIGNGATGRTILSADNGGRFSGFRGNLNVLSGYLRASNDNALGDPGTSTTITIGSGATLELAGGITIPSTKTIAISGVPVGNSSKIVGVSGDNLIQGNIPIAGGNNVALDVAAGTSLTVAGVLSGSRDIDKNGTGTLVLSGTNTNTGNVNVGDGTLIVDGSLASSSLVFGDGIVGGSGTVPGVTISGIGTLAPGDSPGILHTGNLAFTDGSTYAVQIDGAAVGTGYDQADVTGTVALAGATLSVSLGYLPDAGTVFTVVNNDGSDAVSGTFGGLPEGGTVAIGGQSFAVSYVGGTGNDVTLTALARTSTWTGLGGDNNWSTAANWDANRAPSGGENLVFPAGAARPSNVNDLSGKTFRSIEIDGGGYDIIGNAIGLTGGIADTDAAGVSTFALDTALAATETVDVAAGGTLVLSGALSGSGFGVAKTGGGTLYYAGEGANTYGGTTTVDGGTLVLAKGGADFAVAGNLVVGDGTAPATVQYAAANQVVNSGGVTLRERATLDLGGFSEVVAALDMTGATLSMTTGLVIVLDGVTTHASTVTAGLPSTIRGGALYLNGNAAFPLTVADDPGLASDLTISSVITLGGIDKEGAGVVAFAGANTYAGITAVDAGAIRVENAQALGAPGDANGGYTDVKHGGSLVLDVPGLTLGEFIFLADQGTGGVPTLWNEADGVTLSGEISLHYATVSNFIPLGTADGTTMTLAGPVTQSSPDMVLIVANGATGRVVLAGDNTFSGGMIDSKGFARATVANAFGDPTTTSYVFIENGATLEFAGGVTTPPTKGLYLDDPGVEGSAKVVNVSGDNVFGGTITLRASQAIDAAAGSLTLAGAIDGEGYGLTKVGPGALSLDATDAYTGPTAVDLGTLLVDGDITSSGGVTVGAGGTLGGGGAVPAITVAGIVAPGTSGTTAILSSGDATFAPSASFLVDLGGARARGGYDQLNVAGAVDLGGATLGVSVLATPGVGDTYTILNNDGSDPVVGAFNGLPEGSAITVGLVHMRISYAGGSNHNDVVLTVTDVTYTWDGGGGDDNWSTAANWVGDVAPTPGANLVFPDQLNRLDNTNDLPADTHFHDITLAGASYAIHGNAVDLDGTIAATYDAGEAILAFPIALRATETIGVAAGGSLRIDSAISGPGFGVTKTGGGTLTFGGGAAANTYTGATGVDAGTLVLNKDGGVDAFAGGLRIGDNATAATVRLNAPDQIPDASAVAVGEGSLLDLADHAETFAGLALRGASVAIGGGRLTLTTGLASIDATDNAPSTIAGAGFLDLGGNASFPMTVADDPGVDVDLRISAPIRDGGIAKAGAGTLALSGANTYGGGTDINAGVLAIGNDTGAGTGVVNILGTTTLDISGGITVANTLNLDSGGTAIRVSGGANTLLGAVNLGVDATIDTAPASSLVIASVVGDSQNGIALTKAGAGTLRLDASNTYGGGTTVAAGLLVIGKSGALGTGDVVDDAEIEIVNNLLIDNNFTINTAGTAFLVDGLTTIQGTISLLSDLAIDTPGFANLYLNGVVVGGGGLAKTGGGTLGLGRANSYGGGTTIVGGSLQVFDGRATGTAGAVAIGGGATLVQSTTTYTLPSGGLSLAGSSTFLVPLANVQTLNGPITLAGDATFDVASGGSLAVGGAIGGPFGLTKIDAGTLILRATSAYTGPTTVSAGVLRVDGALSASSPVAIGASGTLTGVGAVGAVTGNGGTLAPGGGPGVLHAGGVTLDGASTFAVALDGPTAGVGYSQLVGAGPIDLGGATLGASLGEYSPRPGDVLTIVDNAGASPIVRTFAGLGEGATIAVSGETFRISYVGGTGNDVTLTALGATTTRLSTNAATATYGDSLTLTAVVSSPSGTPTGLVSFYDGPAIPANLLGTATLSPAGTATYTTTTMSASPHSLSAVYGGADPYLGGTSSAVAQAVNQATLTVTADNQSRAYGDANPTFTATFAGFKNGETPATGGVTGSPGLSTSATPTSPVAGGPYAITAALGSLAAGNYGFRFVGGSLVVARATLDVTADNQSRIYGEANPTFTATFAGFKNGETPATGGVTGSPGLSSSATPTSPVAGGPYAITAALGSLAAGNYGFRFVGGSLVVARADLTITADHRTKALGAAPPTLTATYAGFKNGETAASLDAPPTLATTATEASPAGTYPITVGGAADPNYSIVYVDGTLTVEPAPSHRRFVINDFDGDGKSDVAVYLPAQGAFSIRYSSGIPDRLIPFGTPGQGQSIPVAGDFDGDGKADLAVYLPSQANLAYRPSSGGPDVNNPFGTAGPGQTLPAPGDYFGTGKTDIAAYLPARGVYALRDPRGGPDFYIPFGVAGAGQSIPDPGDYDGDGKADLAVYLPGTGVVGIRPSGGGVDRLIPFGTPGQGQSIPVAGDFDGDGKADLAVYLPSRADLAYRPSSGGPDVNNPFGTAGPGQTLPAPGDYAGAGDTQVAAYMPAPGEFAIRPRGGHPDSAFAFGIAGPGQSTPISVVDEALSQLSTQLRAESILDFASVLSLGTARKKARN